MQHTHNGATGKGRGTVIVNQLDVDVSMATRKRDNGIARIEQVEIFGGSREIGNKYIAPCSHRVSSLRTG